MGVSPANKIVISREQELFIKENFFKMTVPELAEQMGFKTWFVRKVANDAGLKKFEMEYWKPEMVDLLELVYPYLGDTEIAEYFQEHYPKSKPWIKKHIEKKRRYLKLKRDADMKKRINKRNTMQGCFEICNKKMWEKRGVTPIGGIKIWKSEYGREVAFVKTQTGFVPRNPWLWEQHYGPVPDGMCVHASDDVSVVCEVTDLVLKTKSEIMDIVRYSDKVIVKRQLKVKDPDHVQEYIENHPHLINAVRATLIVNRKVNELRRKKQ